MITARFPVAVTTIRPFLYRVIFAPRLDLGVGAFRIVLTGLTFATAVTDLPSEVLSALSTKIVLPGTLISVGGLKPRIVCGVGSGTEDEGVGVSSVAGAREPGTVGFTSGIIVGESGWLPPPSPPPPPGADGITEFETVDADESPLVFLETTVNE
jgi:hypothetical protein